MTTFHLIETEEIDLCLFKDVWLLSTFLIAESQVDGGTSLLHENAKSTIIGLTLLNLNLPGMWLNPI